MRLSLFKMCTYSRRPAGTDAGSRTRYWIPCWLRHLCTSGRWSRSLSPGGWPRSSSPRSCGSSHSPRRLPAGHRYSPASEVHTVTTLYRHYQLWDKRIVKTVRQNTLQLWYINSARCGTKNSYHYVTEKSTVTTSVQRTSYTVYSTENGASKR